MVNPVDIEAARRQMVRFEGRRPDTSEDELEPTFATLAPYRDGAIFLASFSGDSAWERHAQGDEIVHVVEGKTRVILLTDEGENVLDITAGQLIVVPQAAWHRFEAPNGVTVMTVTPQPTDHSTAKDPRQEG